MPMRVTTALTELEKDEPLASHHSDSQCLPAAQKGFNKFASTIRLTMFWIRYSKASQDPDGSLV
jgi:hypothetical protein